jgi:hypothetical protein
MHIWKPLPEIFLTNENQGFLHHYCSVELRDLPRYRTGKSFAPTKVYRRALLISGMYQQHQ